MKFSGKVGSGPENKCLNFGGDPDPVAILVRRALAEVGTVPVLLVCSSSFSLFFRDNSLQ